MTRVEQVNSRRIEWCCADYGMSTQDLATEVGIAPGPMAAIVVGEQQPTYLQLERIARFFGRGVLFFLEEGEPAAENVHSPAFRTLANQKPQMSAKMRALIERAERQREVYVALREELGDGDYPRFAPPDLVGLPTKRAARIARQWLGLTNEGTFAAYRARVEAAGVLVFRSNGYNGKWQIPKENPILGFSLFDQTCPLIVVKKEQWETRQTFTLMHELGHLLLQRSSSIDDEQDFFSDRIAERRANSFAGLLLVPDDHLERIVDNERPDDASEFDDWLALDRDRWGVSTEVILRRLMDEGRLTQEKYEAYRAWSNNRPAEIFEEATGTRMYRHREPKHIFGDRFVRLVLDAMGSERITLTRASSYLDSLKISDLRALERHYAGL